MKWAKSRFAKPKDGQSALAAPEVGMSIEELMKKPLQN